MTKINRSKERIKETSEVFTTEKVVNDILNQFPSTVWQDDEFEWSDHSCGNGNFLVEIKHRLLEHGHSLENVLSRIYGADIMPDNVDECRYRLDPNNEYPHLICKNIIQADGLQYHYRFDFSFSRDDIIEREKKLDEKEESFKIRFRMLDEMNVALMNKKRELTKRERKVSKKEQEVIKKEQKIIKKEQEAKTKAKPVDEETPSSYIDLNEISKKPLDIR